MDLETFPPAFRAELRTFPAALIELLADELRAGNELDWVGGGFPAPPVGACAVLKRAITTRAREDGGALRFERWPNASLPSGFHDEPRHYFVMEPREPEPAAPSVEEIRARLAPSPTAIPQPAVSTAREPAPIHAAPTAEPSSLVARFVRSMQIDVEKWRDGIGYDIDLIDAASPSERADLELLLVSRGASNWRDVEALATLATPRAQEALRVAAFSDDAELRMAVMRHAPELLDDDGRTASLVRALETSAIFTGLSHALDEIGDFHPAPVVDALFRGALERDGEAACHFAAMLWHVHGMSPEPFDMAERPFFLRFNTEDREERTTAFAELCARLGVDPSGYLAGR